MENPGFPPIYHTIAKARIESEQYKKEKEMLVNVAKPIMDRIHRGHTMIIANKDTDCRDVVALIDCRPFEMELRHISNDEIAGKKSTVSSTADLFLRFFITKQKVLLVSLYTFKKLNSNLDLFGRIGLLKVSKQPTHEILLQLKQVRVAENLKVQIIIPSGTETPTPKPLKCARYVATSDMQNNFAGGLVTLGESSDESDN